MMYVPNLYEVSHRFHLVRPSWRNYLKKKKEFQM